MKVGNNEVKDILLGETPIVKVYRGEDVIWERGGLPSGYRQVEYLESTGTQYIDMGVVGTRNTKIYSRYKHTTSMQRSYIFGGCQVWNANTIYAGYNDIWHGLIVLFTKATTTNNIVITNYNTAKEHELVIDKTNVTLDDVIYNYSTPPSDEDFTTPVNLYLYCMNSNGTMYYVSKIQIYSCKIYENDILVRDFIPCLDNNQRPCMYDLITKQPFYNQGTGEFLYA